MMEVEGETLGGTREVEEEGETLGGTREVEEEDDGNIRVNPFMLSPVVQALFEHLSFEDLTKCRLVNKLWYEESLSTWRSNVTLKFREEGIVSTRDDGSSSTTSLGVFLDLWDAEEWGSCPFRNFNFHKWGFNFEAEDVEQSRFLELVGDHITSLTLDKCVFYRKDNFRRMIYQALPNLQLLKIEHCGSSRIIEIDNKSTEVILEYEEPEFGAHGLRSLELSGCHPRSMMDMLSHFHKLESLRIEEGGSVPSQAFYNFNTGWTGSDYRNLLEAIRLIRAQDRTKLPLKNFDVDSDFDLGRDAASSIELLQLHEQLNLPIQRLFIHFGWSWSQNEGRNDADVIRNIFQYHSSTLKYLRFDGNDEQRLCRQFPFGFYLENLNELVFPSYLSKSLSFLIPTPNLRILSIWNERDRSMSESDNVFSNSSRLEIEDWTFPSLTNLAFNAPLSLCNLQKLIKWMPNLERLSGLKLDDVKFSLVCKTLKHLKVLRDCGSELSDEGVIGIENVHGASGDEGTLIGPNITKLKDLTTFWTSSSNLTSASVTEGFLKLANLKKLWLGRSSKIGNKAVFALARRNIKLVYN